MGNNNKLQKSFVMKSGERYCLIVNGDTGLPLYFPNLYITTQVRNRSLSCSAMETSLAAIAVLLRFMDEINVDIENRFRRHEYFEAHELDAIRDYCHKKISIKLMSISPSDVLRSEKHREVDGKVTTHTAYVRITAISHYIKWLAETLSSENRDRNVTAGIYSMFKGLQARRPPKSNRNSGLNVKGLNQKQIEVLFELLRPESAFNLFENHSVKVRNRLMILLLYHLGLRGGELLNIRIGDIDFNSNQILIIRRADEADDPRRDQPLAKTRDRRLPLKDTLVKEIHNYIIHHRKLVVRPKQPDYLFVTHKEGPSKGLPLTKSGYKKIMQAIRSVAPDLFNLTGHQLRHSWGNPPIINCS